MWPEICSFNWSKNIPDWHKMDDVYYWLSIIYFEQGEIDKALKASAKIKSRDVKKDAASMKVHYLTSINELERLKSLLQQNPYDAQVAKVLAQKISERPSTPENRQLLDFLISEFSLDEKAYKIVKAVESKKKDTYKVAVLFPFMVDELNQERNVRSNQFVLDTYEGIKVAVEQLNEQGKNITLYAYDTKRDSAVTAGIVARPELKQMDLIIGPLYPVASKIVSDFTYKYKINMVNPLSTNSEVVGGNPMSFLFKPSLKTQATAAAAYASKTFVANPKTMIIYGETQKDSVLAFNYQKVAQEKGLKVVRMEKVGQARARHLLKMLARQGSAPDTLKNDIGHLFIATSDELVVANAISALEIRGDRLPVVTLEDWLDLKFVSFEQLERLEVKFIAPNYINYENEDVTAFKNLYLQQTNAPPSLYAYAGYDMMTFFGNMLHEYGTYFQQGLVDRAFDPGLIFSGYVFKDQNDNQFVPIVQFREQTLQLINEN